MKNLTPQSSPKKIFSPAVKDMLLRLVAAITTIVLLLFFGLQIAER
jgi:hypothetical protein